MNTSPGSHYQESALSAPHVAIAENALVEFLDWYCRQSEGIAGSSPRKESAPRSTITHLGDWKRFPIAKLALLLAFTCAVCVVAAWPYLNAPSKSDVHDDDLAAPVREEQQPAISMPRDVDVRLASLEAQLRQSAPDEPYSTSKVIPNDLSRTEIAVRGIEEIQEQGAAISDAETYYRMGNFYYTTGDFSKSISLYKRAIENRPDWYKPHLALALALEASEQWTDAIQAYQRADKLLFKGEDSEGKAMVLINLGTTAFAREDYHGAVIQGQRSVVLFPSIAGYNLLASAYAKLGDEPNEYEALRLLVEEFNKQLGKHDSEAAGAAKRRMNILQERLGKKN